MGLLSSVPTADTQEDLDLERVLLQSAREAELEVCNQAFKVDAREERELELALFQSAFEADLEAKRDITNQIAIAEEQETILWQQTMATEKAKWVARSETVFEMNFGNGIANGFYAYFGKYGPQQVNRAKNEACRDAAYVNVLHDSTVVESWVRNGPFPNPWRRNHTVLVTVSHVSVEREGMDTILRVELVLMSGTVFQVSLASDACAATLAGKVQLERELDSPVTLVGPSGMILQPGELILNLEFGGSDV